MALIPVSNSDGSDVGLTISVDVENRICLNAAFKREIGHEKETYLYVYWDSEYRRIGLSKTCADKLIVPYKFDNRGYSKKTRDFVEHCDIDNSSAVRFLYEGKEGDIYVFAQTGRRVTKLKQQKNGNLERM